MGRLRESASKTSAGVIVMRLLHSFELDFPCTLQQAALFERDVEAKTLHFVTVGGVPIRIKNSWGGFFLESCQSGNWAKYFFWGV